MILGSPLIKSEFLVHNPKNSKRLFRDPNVQPEKRTTNLGVFFFPQIILKFVNHKGFQQSMRIIVHLVYSLGNRPKGNDYNSTSQIIHNLVYSLMGVTCSQTTFHNKKNVSLLLTWWARQSCFVNFKHHYFKLLCDTGKLIFFSLKDMLSFLMIHTCCFRKKCIDQMRTSFICCHLNTPGKLSALWP